MTFNYRFYSVQLTQQAPRERDHTDRLADNWFTQKSTVNESHICSGGAVRTTFDGSSHLRMTLRYPLGISLGYFLWYNPLGYIHLGISLCIWGIHFGIFLLGIPLCIFLCGIFLFDILKTNQISLSLSLWYISLGNSHRCIPLWYNPLWYIPVGYFSLYIPLGYIPLIHVGIFLSGIVLWEFRKKERKQTTQGRDGRTVRRHHTGILGEK